MKKIKILVTKTIKCAKIVEVEASCLVDAKRDAIELVSSLGDDVVWGNLERASYKAEVIHGE